MLLVVLVFPNGICAERSTGGHDACSCTFTKLKWKSHGWRSSSSAPDIWRHPGLGGEKGLDECVCERAGNMRTEVTPNKHSLLATWVSLQAFPHSGSQKKTWGCFCTAAPWTPALNALRYIVGPLEQLWGKGCEREKKKGLSLNPKELRWSAHLLASTAASMCSTDVTVFHQLIFFSLLRALTSSFLPPQSVEEQRVPKDTHSTSLSRMSLQDIIPHPHLSFMDVIVAGFQNEKVKQCLAEFSVVCSNLTSLCLLVASVFACREPSGYCHV